MGFALQTDHVPKRHGQAVAVDDLSFRVGPGRITGGHAPATCKITNSNCHIAFGSVAKFRIT